MGLLSLIGRVFRTLCDFTPSRRWCIFAHTSARQMATHAISSLAFRLTLHAVSWSASTLIFLLTHLCTALTFCYDSTRSSNDCARDFFGTSEHFVHDQLHNGPAPGHSLTAVEVSPDSLRFSTGALLLLGRSFIQPCFSQITPTGSQACCSPTLYVHPQDTASQVVSPARQTSQTQAPPHVSRSTRSWSCSQNNALFPFCFSNFHPHVSYSSGF